MSEVREREPCHHSFDHHFSMKHHRYSRGWPILGIDRNKFPPYSKKKEEFPELPPFESIGNVPISSRLRRARNVLSPVPSSKLPPVHLHKTRNHEISLRSSLHVFREYSKFQISRLSFIIISSRTILKQRHLTNISYWENWVVGQ